MREPLIGAIHVSYFTTLASTNSEPADFLTASQPLLVIADKRIGFILLPCSGWNQRVVD